MWILVLLSAILILSSAARSKDHAPGVGLLMNMLDH